MSAVTSLNAHKNSLGSGTFERIIDIAKGWGIDAELWEREWSNLSGGEAQRIALATAVGLGTAEVILLDGMRHFHISASLFWVQSCFTEPTSALDSLSCAAVEKFVKSEVQSATSPLKAIVWITHSDEQGSRVGTRFIHITPAGCTEEPIPIV